MERLDAALNRVPTAACRLMRHLQRSEIKIQKSNECGDKGAFGIESKFLTLRTRQKARSYQLSVNS